MSTQSKYIQYLVMAVNIEMSCHRSILPTKIAQEAGIVLLSNT